MKTIHHFMKHIFVAILLLVSTITANAVSCGSQGTCTFIPIAFGSGKVEIKAHFVPAINSNYVVCNFGDGTSDTLYSYNYAFYHQYTDTGTYSVCIVGYNTTNNCSDTACTTIHVPCIIRGTIQNNTSGGITTLSASISSVTPIVSYLWGGNPNYIGSVTGPTATFNSQDGNYIASLTITDVEDCTNTLYSQITLPNASPCNLEASFRMSPLGYGYNFTNTSSASNGYVSQWSYYDSRNINLLLITSNENNPVFPWPVNVQLIIVDTINGGCRDTATISYTHSCTPLMASFTYQNLGNNTAQFHNTINEFSISNLYNYYWTFYNSSGQIGASSDWDTQFTFTGNPPYLAALDIVDVASNTCTETWTETLSLTDENSTCVEIQPDGFVGVDAVCTSYLPADNFGSVTDLFASQWNIGGNKEARGLLRFDLSFLPPGATITSAYVSLYANTNASTPGSGNVGRPMGGSNNSCYLKRVTAPWSEMAVNWNNQPASTTADQVFLHPTYYSPHIIAQDYPDLNITGFAQYWYQNPTENYGMLLDMINTSMNQNLTFCSSDYPDPVKRPKLVVCYSFPDSCNASAQFSYQDLGNNTVQFGNTSTSTNGYNSLWTFSDSSGQIGTGTSANPQFTFTGNAPYTATLTITDVVNNTCTDTITQTLNLVQNSCNLYADFTYTAEGSNPNNTDTIVVTNTSISNSGFGFYQITAYNAGGSIVYLNSGLSPFTPTSFTVPHSTSWNICIQIEDSTGTCIDTICKTVYPLPCAIQASFTWTLNGTALLLNNTSTDNHGAYTSYWTIQGGVPSASPLTNPVVSVPTNMDSSRVCLIASDAQGCSDTSCSVITKNDTLCGLVFNDANGNGILDLGESPRPNSNVRIDGINYYTDASGFYHIGVGMGTHSILLIAPAGWSQTFPTNPLSYSTATTGASYICGLDFGMRDDTLLLSGLVYIDNNGNGLYDGGDVPLSNQLVHINGANGNYNVYTNASGYYSLVVYSGTYVISYSPPTGYTLTQPINPNTYTLTVVSTSVSGLNFGSRNNSIIITGKLYVDANSNGAYDNGEVLINNQPVHIGNVTVYTNSSGVYSSLLPAGTYLITYSPTGSYVNYTSAPASFTVDASVPGTIYDNNDFRLTFPPNIGDVCVAMNPWSHVVAGFPAYYHISVYNYGNIPMQGVLYMYYDPNLAYHTSSPTPSGINTGSQTLSWNITSNPGQTITVNPRFMCSSTLPLGSFVFNAVEFIPGPGFIDVNMACNSDTVHQISRGSWDPNDKQVSPVGENPDGRITNEQELSYTISFQNTGTSPAVNVILIDTLESDLDLNTFEMRGGSHEYHLQIEGRVLTWIFSNIMLPDSGTDYENSMGFVSFRIKPVAGLSDGTEIVNSANIYFDYNDAVITNHVLNTIDISVFIEELESGRVTITLLPNPFGQYTIVRVEGAEAPYELKVFDVLGKLMKSVTADKNIFTLERGNISAGMYIFNVTKDGKVIGKGKMVAE